MGEAPATGKFPVAKHWWEQGSIKKNWLWLLGGGHDPAREKGSFDSMVLCSAGPLLRNEGNVAYIRKESFVGGGKTLWLGKEGGVKAGVRGSTNQTEKGAKRMLGRPKMGKRKEEALKGGNQMPKKSESADQI